MADDPIEAEELERAADWRIRKLGEDPADTQSAAAAKLLQKLAEELRGLRGSPAYTEYLAILNWLGEFDVTEEFADAPMPTGRVSESSIFRKTARRYLRGLIALAKDTAGM